MCIVGTNNARLATMLRQLAIYHAKDPNNLFCVRIAQGLTHLSKGTLTLCPYHADRQIMNPVAVAGLLTFLVSCLDVKTSKYSGTCIHVSLQSVVWFLHDKISDKQRLLKLFCYKKDVLFFNSSIT